VLQLFTSVETTFNEIWGVRRGRSWLMRIVFYWTILTLGALFFFAAATGLSATAFLTAFAEKLPFGQQVRETLIFLLPLGSTALMIVTLTIFYRTIRCGRRRPADPAQQLPRVSVLQAGPAHPQPVRIPRHRIGADAGAVRFLVLRPAWRHRQLRHPECSLPQQSGGVE
jgi:hypothetical protein